MKASIYLFINCLLAEIQKHKRTVVFWLLLLGSLCISSIVFLNMYMDSMDQVVPIGMNPWDRYLKFCIHTLAVFVVPFLVVLNSAILHFEHRSESWKKLYSLPIPRVHFYFSKLFFSIIALFLFYLLFFVLVFSEGYLLSYLKPSYEFNYYPPNLSLWYQAISHSFIASLGLIAIQYWLSLRWKNFIVSIGIGLLGFIIMLILMNQTELVAYFPYSYPVMMLLKFGFNESILGLKDMGPLANVEWFSLVSLVLFTTIGFVEENRKDIIN